jgi:hypothetical protein
MASRRLERMRSDLAMGILHELEQGGQVVGSRMHCGGSVRVNLVGIGGVTIGVLVDQDLEVSVKASDAAAQEIAERALVAAQGTR